MTPKLAPVPRRMTRTPLVRWIGRWHTVESPGQPGAVSRAPTRCSHGPRDCAARRAAAGRRSHRPTPDKSGPQARRVAERRRGAHMAYVPAYDARARSCRRGRRNADGEEHAGRHTGRSRCGTAAVRGSTPLRYVRPARRFTRSHNPLTPRPKPLGESCRRSTMQ
jgi:hypothetical protein